MGMLQTWTDEDEQCNLRSFFHPVQEEKPNTFDPETFVWGSKHAFFGLAPKSADWFVVTRAGNPEVTTALNLPDAVVNFEVSKASFNLYTAYREEASDIQKLFGIQLISGHRPYALPLIESATRVIRSYFTQVGSEAPAALASAPEPAANVASVLALLRSWKDGNPADADPKELSDELNAHRKYRKL